ncbi:MAG: DUF1266 domain-containing protein [Flavobacteriaceae bacterium]
MSEILSHPWAKYVIGAVVLILWGYRYFKQGRNSASEGLITQSQTSTLTKTQQFSMALDAIMSVHWSVDNNILPFTHKGKKPRDFDAYMKGWYINTREGYLDLTNYFLNDGRRGYFNTIYPIFKNEPKETWYTKLETEYGNNDRAKRMFDRLGKHNIIAYLQTQGIIEFESDIEIGSMGWDISTLVGQARRAFTANLISEAEAWEIIGKATQMAKNNFNSWDEFGRSQLIGMTMDFYIKDNGYCTEYINHYRSIRSNPNSPWNTLAWEK